MTEKIIRTTGFCGMLIIDTVVAVSILAPLSIVEIVTNRDLGSCSIAKQLSDITIQIGTLD